MDSRWFQRQDLPHDSEVNRRALMMKAIRELPYGDRISESDLEELAVQIFMTAERARYDERPISQDASIKASEAELRKFHDLCNKLSLHIASMHRQAASSLYGEGCVLFLLERELEAAQRAARGAFSKLNAPEKVAGARPKIAAEHTGLQAGLIFEHVTGSRPTYTSDPETSAVSGPWVNFLSRTYEALGIEASAGAQVKALSQKLAEISAN